MRSQPQFEKVVMQELKEIKTELEEIRERMIDVDMLLTKGEHVLLDESLKNEKKRKLIPLEKIKR